MLDSWDVMVLKPFDHELCRIDTVQMLDGGSHFFKGSVFLGDFVPYKRVDGQPLGSTCQY